MLTPEIILTEVAIEGNLAVSFVLYPDIEFITEALLKQKQVTVLDIKSLKEYNGFVREFSVFPDGFTSVKIQVLGVKPANDMIHG